MQRENRVLLIWRRLQYYVNNIRMPVHRDPTVFLETNVGIIPEKRHSRRERNPEFLKSVSSHMRWKISVRHVHRAILPLFASRTGRSQRYRKLPWDATVWEPRVISCAMFCCGIVTFLHIAWPGLGRLPGRPYPRLFPASPSCHRRRLGHTEFAATA